MIDSNWSGYDWTEISFLLKRLQQFLRLEMQPPKSLHSYVAVAVAEVAAAAAAAAGILMQVFRNLSHRSAIFVGS